MKAKLLKKLRKNYNVKYESSVNMWSLRHNRHFMSPMFKEDTWQIIYYWIGISLSEKQSKVVISMLMKKITLINK